jgi:hypothetical protein
MIRNDSHRAFGSKSGSPELNIRKSPGSSGITPRAAQHKKKTQLNKNLTQNRIQRNAHEESPGGGSPERAH